MPHKNNRCPVILLLLLVLTLGAATAAWAGGPEVGPNVQVSDPQQLFPADFPSRNTTTIAASEDGQSLLAGWDDFQGFCGPPTNRACPPQNPPGISGYGFSTDGGQTWTDGGSPFPVGLAQTAGHPWVDRGRVGDEDVFFFTSRMRTGASGSAGIGIHRGRFAAGTFVWDDAVVIAQNDFASRQSIAAAKDGSGAAYIVQSNLITLCGFVGAGLGQIEVYRTHDGGDSWQGPVVVGADATEVTDPNDPFCALVGNIQVAPVPAIGPNGELYVIWQFGPRFIDGVNTTRFSSIAFSRSLDGGVTFDPPRFIATLNNMRENPVVGYGKNRMNDQPRITVATTGQHRGRIYVTFHEAVEPVESPATVQSLVSSDIFVMYSDDQGATWSAPAHLAAPVPPTGVKRIWPTVSVRPGGVVDVVYLESQETQSTPDPNDVECNVPLGGGNRRIGPVSSLVDTWWVQSKDGGTTWSPPVRVSSETGNWCRAAYTFGGGLYSNFGDYIGLVSGGNRSWAVWPDGRNNFSDIFAAELKGKVDE